MSFDSIFKGIQKSIEGDKNSRLYKSGDITMNSEVPYGILTGIPRLDLAIGRPGYPAGKVIEAFGFEKSGKSTALQHAIAQAQRAGGGGLLIDTEFSYDEDRAIQLGIDPDKNFAVAEADSVESIFRIVDGAITSILDSGFDGPFIVGVDSITGVATELEHKKKFGEAARVGEDARAIRGSMRKLMPKLAKSKVCLYFVNHAIAKVAAMAFAKQSDSSGGHAIKFFASLRCSFAGSGQLSDGTKEEKKLDGQKISIRVEKLKRAALSHPVINDIELRNDFGISLTNELLLAGKKTGFIEVLNQRTSKYKDIDFTNPDWPDVVKEVGGPQKVYNEFIEDSITKGLLRPWNEHLYR